MFQVVSDEPCCKYQYDHDRLVETHRQASCHSPLTTADVGKRAQATAATPPDIGVMQRGVTYKQSMPLII